MGELEIIDAKAKKAKEQFNKHLQELMKGL